MSLIINMIYFLDARKYLTKILLLSGFPKELVNYCFTKMATLGRVIITMMLSFAFTKLTLGNSNTASFTGSVLKAVESTVANFLFQENAGVDSSCDTYKCPDGK